MKNILLIHTGGTIAMSEDQETGAVSTTASNPLIEGQALIKQFAKIEERVLYHLPSPHITPNHMLEIGKYIESRIGEFDGVVITHGTDTLEETAYFLDLYIETKKPIVITGAMRSSNEIGSDGLYNLNCAIRVATVDESFEKGVLVVMNDEIHTAAYVTKTATSNVATFQSPQFGPIGMITKQDIYFYHKWISYEKYECEQISKQVPLLKAYAGMDKGLFEALLEMNIDGLVIEGFGQGNLPPEMVDPLKKLLNNHIPVVLVSRSFKGVVQPTYSYLGGGKQLHDMGIIFAKRLNGQKARIKLLMVLESTRNQDVHAYFE
ncbi:asparaginase [Paraliobacillus sp. JSM ZJ581]|uniref:asparaginase n=1 Tax=Paraliobacillus sp. JSM ZJ581 TaxID=3342118 RepID=UPI0035A8EA1A